MEKEATRSGEEEPERGETSGNCTLFVGGLDRSVTKELLQAAFAPFGEITDVSIPLDREHGEPRGFGFVEFEEHGDAVHAAQNMNGAELCGRVLRVNFSSQDAKPSNQEG